MPDISAKKTPPFTLGLWAEETTRGSPYELATLGPYRGPTKVVVGEIFNFEGRAPDLLVGVRRQALPQRYDLGLSPQLPNVRNRTVA